MTWLDHSRDNEGKRPTKGCPFHKEAVKSANTSVPTRKTTPPTYTTGPALHKDEAGVWHVRGFAQARSTLRADGTNQAGFRAEQVMKMTGGMRPPILYQEGELHREQRVKTARFFTPATTARNYRGFMDDYAEALVDELKQAGQADLTELSMHMAVQVAAKVVGLTDSRRPGMARRLERFFQQTENENRIARMANSVRSQWAVFAFYNLDVLPAIKKRRQEPAEDLISHLVEEGYTPMEILTECITFAAAGMITTREFISIAAWHLMEHPTLKSRYLAAEEKERHDILHELLRLEPVVGHILRRAEKDVAVESDGEQVTIPAGSLIDIHVYSTNVDESAVGEEPLSFCPERELGRGVQGHGLSFGDGNHRCPGAFIAIQETDIFLTKLLALEGLEIQQPPTVTRKELVKGYELRNFILTVPPTTATA